MLSPEFLARLVCPATKEPLAYLESANVLIAPNARLRYRIDNGAPVLLVEEAQPATQAEIDMILRR